MKSPSTGARTSGITSTSGRHDTELKWAALRLGAASFDRGVGIIHHTGEITHHNGPDLDADRELVIGDRQEAGRCP